MIEGFRVLFYRVLYGLFIMLIMPVYNYIYEYVISTNPTFCAASLPIINQGVEAIKWIVFIGIAAGCYHLYYRAVMVRSYENTFSQQGPWQGR